MKNPFSRRSTGRWIHEQRPYERTFALGWIRVLSAALFVVGTALAVAASNELLDDVTLTITGVVMLTALGILLAQFVFAALLILRRKMLEAIRRSDRVVRKFSSTARTSAWLESYTVRLFKLWKPTSLTMTHRFPLPLEHLPDTLCRMRLLLEYIPCGRAALMVHGSTFVGVSLRRMSTIHLLEQRLNAGVEVSAAKLQGLIPMVNSSTAKSVERKLMKLGVGVVMVGYNHRDKTPETGYVKVSSNPLLTASVFNTRRFLSAVSGATETVTEMCTHLACRGDTLYGHMIKHPVFGEYAVRLRDLGITAEEVVSRYLDVPDIEVIVDQLELLGRLFPSDRGSLISWHDQVKRYFGNNLTSCMEVAEELMPGRSDDVIRLVVGTDLTVNRQNSDPLAARARVSMNPDEMRSYLVELKRVMGNTEVSLENAMELTKDSRGRTYSIYSTLKPLATKPLIDVKNKLSVETSYPYEIIRREGSPPEVHLGGLIVPTITWMPSDLDTCIQWMNLGALMASVAYVEGDPLAPPFEDGPSISMELHIVDVEKSLEQHIKPFVDQGLTPELTRALLGI